MRKFGVGVLLVVSLFASPVLAKHYSPQHHRHYLGQGSLQAAQNTQPWAWSASKVNKPSRSFDTSRPSAWCGWFARFNFLGHDPGPEYNLAANWKRIGSPASSPAPGEIVVWPHHVGKIVGPCQGNNCVVWSGNDGHTVRTRMRSVAGAVFRSI
jgi:hypothetical protein